jgi:DNA-binding response OmpR family regulator
MLWDDFARVGAPIIPGPRLRGVVLGWPDFPPALTQALARAGVVVEEASGVDRLSSLLRVRTPDLVLATAAAAGPDPEDVAARIAGINGSVPAILVTSEHAVPNSFPGRTLFSELLGSGQDALGYFLMLRATLRRKRPHAVTDVLSCGGLALDQETFTLSFAEARIPLNKLQFCVFGAMLDAPRMVWNKVFLNRVVFGPINHKPGRQIDTYMSLAHRAVRDTTGTDLIVAQHGIGYALSPEVLGGLSVAVGGDLSAAGRTRRLRSSVGGLPSAI